MLLARVEGNVVSAIRHESLSGWRLLICQPLGTDEQPQDYPLVALDNLGAGMHQRVILTSDGKSVREKVGDQYSPARYMVMAIADEDAGTSTAETGA